MMCDPTRSLLNYYFDCSVCPWSDIFNAPLKVKFKKLNFLFRQPRFQSWLHVLWQVKLEAATSLQNTEIPSKTPQETGFIWGIPWSLIHFVFAQI